MLGGSLDCRASGTLVVNCSFWIGSTFMVTSGLAEWKPAAACCQTPLSGSEVPLCHHVSVTGPFAFLLAEPPLLLSPPQAAIVNAVAAQATTAKAARARMLRMSIHSSSGLRTTGSVTQSAQLCQSLSITF